MKRIAALILFATSAIAGETVTLDEAIERAIAHNANVQNARIEIEKGQTRIDAMRTKRLPQMSLSIVGGEALNNISIEIEDDRRNTRVDLGRTFSMFGVARISQPITQQHAIGLGIRMHEASLAMHKENERAARLAITREVKNAYFAVLSARAYADATEEAVTAWEEVEREMIVRVAAQAALEADRLDAAARLASTRLAALSANNALASAKDRLQYLVGAEVDVDAMHIPELVALAKSNADARPDVREAQLRVEQAQLDLRLQYADRIPDVALTVSSAMPFNNDNLPRNMTSAGITMSWEPFTWGRQKAEVAEKQHAITQAQNVLRDTQNAAALEIALRERKVAEAAAELAVRRLEVEASRERLRVTKTKFQQQAARPDEMFHASASLTQAAAREQEAIANLRTARADYEQAIGQE